MFLGALIVGFGASLFLANSLPVWLMTFFIPRILELAGLLGPRALLYPRVILPSSGGLFGGKSPLVTGFALLGCTAPLFAFSVIQTRSPWITSLLTVLSLATSFHFGKQMSCLWRVAFITTLWSIWHARNRAVFDEVRPSVHRSLVFILTSIREADHYVRGHMADSVRELLILDHLNIRGRSPLVQTTTVIHWKPMLAGWTKVNVDGSAHFSPGSLFAGAIFRNSRGFFIIAFAIEVGWGYPLEAELASILHAVLFAFDRGWHS
ncbi:hypothetical protein ACS0TY_003577 [Phlomoides rotata]